MKFRPYSLLLLILLPMHPSHLNAQGSNELTLSISKVEGGLATINAQAPPGSVVEFEGSSDLSGTWTLLGKSALTNSSAAYPVAAAGSNMFIRAKTEAIPSVPLAFTFRNDSVFQPRALEWSEGPYFNSQPSHLPDTALQDSSGVRVYLQDGVEYDHPVLQGQYALEMINSYLLTTNVAYLNRAVLHADRLISTAVASRDGWYFPYKFRWALDSFTDDWMNPPWYSAMAQGTALSVFTQLWKLTGDIKYHNAAQWVFNTFKIRADGSNAPWTINTDEDGCLWFEEYAQNPELGDFVFNGHIFALFGVYYYYAMSADPDALKLLQGAVSTIRFHINDLRTIGFYAHYCMRHKYLYAPAYQGIHTRVLANLYSLTGDLFFAQASDALMSDAPEVASGTGSFQGGINGFQFDPYGEVLNVKSAFFDSATDLPVTNREVIRNREGVWLKIGGSGELSDLYVKEQYPIIYLKGQNETIRMSPARHIQFLPGINFHFFSFGVDGLPITDKRRYFYVPFDTTFDAKAVINSQVFVRIAEGEFKGLWARTTLETKLDAE
jgi:hypothetical protein